MQAAYLIFADGGPLAGLAGFYDILEIRHGRRILQFRRQLFFSAAALLGLTAAPVSAQTKGTSAPTPPPRQFPRGPSTYGSPSRPTFVDGRAQFDDGSPNSLDIRIEKVCGSTVRLQGHVDSKGQFFFQLNNTSQVDTDASTISSGPTSFGAPDPSAMAMPAVQKPGDIGCEIRAAYPGYRSDTYNIALNVGSENVHVGTLLLHRIAGVNGTTVSVTTALAPKKAQKNYAKGLQLSSKGLFDKAEERIRAAVDSYPKYAVAWFALGQLQETRGDFEAARTSYETAIAADSHYVNPYVQITQMAAQEKKWDDVLTFSKKTLSLNSAEFASAYWYNALANLQLDNFADAEQSLNTLLKLDTPHHYSRAEDLMGRLLLQKGDLTGAAEHLRAYLAANPNASDAAAITSRLNNLAVTAPAPKH